MLLFGGALVLYYILQEVRKQKLHFFLIFYDITFELSFQNL
jgi:hypothetical protein